MSSIHPLAVVSPHADIGQGVTVGPFCIIEDDVAIGDGCQLAGRVVVKNGTTIGAQNIVGEGVVLGGRPQHRSAPERIGRLRIGSGNTIRENVTAHCALHEGDATIIGDRNLIMVNAHIGHDCRVADEVIIANNTMLAGHTTVRRHAYLSGAVAVHQFCRIGQYAMVGGQGHIKRDVPPYVTVDGYTSRIVGLNLIGLRRHGFSDEQIAQLKAAYRLIYRRQLPWQEMLGVLKREFPEGPAAAFYPFLAASQRGFIPARQEPRSRRASLALHAARCDELQEIRRAA